MRSPTEYSDILEFLSQKYLYRKSDDRKLFASDDPIGCLFLDITPKRIVRARHIDITSWLWRLIVNVFAVIGAITTILNFI